MAYQPVTLNAAVYDRLARMRARLGEVLHGTPGALTYGACIGLLMDLWDRHANAASLPPLDELRALLDRYPKRGRPRGSKNRVAGQVDPATAMPGVEPLPTGFYPDAALEKAGLVQLDPHGPLTKGDDMTPEEMDRNVGRIMLETDPASFPFDYPELAQRWKIKSK